MSETARVSPVHRLPDWRLTLPLAQSCPRCGARTRSGVACKGPAMLNGRCRMHGGKSTGPRTSEGRERMRRANTRHGIYSEESRRLRRAVRLLISEALRSAESIRIPINVVKTTSGTSE
jgi:ribosomal protein L32